ncbi:carbon-nitrogen hydrolase [Paenibacillus sp. FSL H8-0548]|uniref:carbon-nitrogen family hydrolase n=1 Tax=Paenibacillus sp. FSL H8-0548 TaxID=1920422 RepID=UPI00096DE26E|nr:carbon-nitrogen family hydrolase [Paenibacillus sp. FSL H8-0548]OMF33802.1 carbon-nitrogen hydrolase [Paenibacillus sp. FSL H8-0548]
MSNQLRLALLQMHIEAGNPEANFEKLASMLEEAVHQAEKPDVIMFPEMWNTGYALTEIQTLADHEGERTKAFLSEFSKKHGVYIIGGSIAERKGDKILNTIFAFNREGEVIADYSKIHLFRLMEEEKYLVAGDKLGKLEIEGTSAGLMICYDIRFPELARKLALEGAKLLFIPAEWPHPRLHHWRTLLAARAIENQMFVIACNRMGSSGDTKFFGHSLVLDPWGETIAQAGEEETILYATIDLALVDAVRSKIPVFEDRRPSIYEA